MFNNLLIILVFLFLFIISTHNKINITKLSIQYIHSGYGFEKKVGYFKKYIEYFDFFKLFN